MTAAVSQLQTHTLLWLLQLDEYSRATSKQIVILSSYNKEQTAIKAAISYWKIIENSVNHDGRRCKTFHRSQPYPSEVGEEQRSRIKVAVPAVWKENTSPKVTSCSIRLSWPISQVSYGYVAAWASNYSWQLQIMTIIKSSHRDQESVSSVGTVLTSPLARYIAIIVCVVHIQLW